MASSTGRLFFFAEQALPVLIEKPFESSARSITLPGIFLKAARIFVPLEHVFPCNRKKVGSGDVTSVSFRI